MGDHCGVDRAVFERQLISHAVDHTHGHRRPLRGLLCPLAEVELGFDGYHRKQKGQRLHSTATGTASQDVLADLRAD